MYSLSERTRSESTTSKFLQNVCERSTSRHSNVWLITKRCEFSVATTKAEGSLSSMSDISPAHWPGPKSAILGASMEPRCTERRPLRTM
jgi:hypothetical protein